MIDSALYYSVIAQLISRQKLSWITSTYFPTLEFRRPPVSAYIVIPSSPTENGVWWFSKNWLGMGNECWSGARYAHQHMSESDGYPKANVIIATTALAGETDPVVIADAIASAILATDPNIPNEA